MINCKMIKAEKTGDFEPVSFIFIENSKVLAMYDKKIEVWTPDLKLIRVMDLGFIKFLNFTNTT